MSLSVKEQILKARQEYKETKMKEFQEKVVRHFGIICDYMKVDDEDDDYVRIPKPADDVFAQALIKKLDEEGFQCFIVSDDKLKIKLFEGDTNGVIVIFFEDQVPEMVKLLREEINKRLDDNKGYCVQQRMTGRDDVNERILNELKKDFHISRELRTASVYSCIDFCLGVGPHLFFSRPQL